MHAVSLVTLATMVIALVGCQRSSDPPTHLFAESERVVEVFPYIDAVSDRVIPRLREGHLPELDIELRIWEIDYSFGDYPSQGYRITRRTGQWEATHICRDTTGEVSLVSEKTQALSSLWVRLFHPNLIPSIRDHPELQYEYGVRDGVLYVIEYVEERGPYRAVAVYAPTGMPSPSADRMLAVLYLIEPTFRRIACPT